MADLASFGVPMSPASGRQPRRRTLSAPTPDDYDQQTMSGSSPQKVNVTRVMPGPSMPSSPMLSDGPSDQVRMNHGTLARGPSPQSEFGGTAMTRLARAANYYDAADSLNAGGIAQNVPMSNTTSYLRGDNLSRRADLMLSPEFGPSASSGRNLAVSRAEAYPSIVAAGMRLTDSQADATQAQGRALDATGGITAESYRQLKGQYDSLLREHNALLGSQGKTDTLGEKAREFDAKQAATTQPTAALEQKDRQFNARESRLAKRDQSGAQGRSQQLEQSTRQHYQAIAKDAGRFSSADEENAWVEAQMKQHHFGGNVPGIAPNGEYQETRPEHVPPDYVKKNGPKGFGWYPPQ